MYFTFFICILLCTFVKKSGYSWDLGFLSFDKVIGMLNIFHRVIIILLPQNYSEKTSKENVIHFCAILSFLLRSDESVLKLLINILWQREAVVCWTESQFFAPQAIPRMDRASVVATVSRGLQAVFRAYKCTSANDELCYIQHIS